MTKEEACEILLTGQNVFLTGAAGTGKTYLLNSYVDYLKKNRIPVAVTASTGIAATHMDGRTVHSWSGIALRKKLSTKELDELFYNTFTNERITGARVLIIDEISMLEERVFTLLDTVCKWVRKNSHPFGGLQIVICGDLFQLPPVPSKGEPPPRYAFHSSAWAGANFRVCYLEKQFRQEDPTFLEMLNAIRNSKVTRETLQILKTRLNQPIHGFPKPTKLYSHRVDVNAINDFELAQLKTEPHIYLMQSHGEADLVRALIESCLAPAELVLKKGALVMFVRNNFGEGYVNGTLGTVVDFEEEAPHYPVIEVKSGTRITARPTMWVNLDPDEKVVASISQVPLRLAWAITIHKSQGMTLDAAEINLGKAFGHGMGYVALSRVRTLEGIKLVGINDVALRVSPEVAAFDAELRRQSDGTRAELVGMDRSLVERLQEDFRIR